MVRDRLQELVISQSESSDYNNVKANGDALNGGISDGNLYSSRTNIINGEVKFDNGETCITLYPPGNDDTPEIEDFLHEVEGAWSSISEIYNECMEISRLHGVMLSTPIPPEKTKLEIEERMTVVQRTASKVRSQIQEISNVLQKVNVNGTDYLPALHRMQQIQYNSLSRSLSLAIAEYESVLNKYKERSDEFLRQQLRIARRSLTEEQYHNYIENNNAEAVFVDNILAETLQARQALDAAKSRQEDLEKLEKSLTELRDMFINMATLVELQGDKIDNIEYFVTQTRNYVEKGREQLKSAQKLQTKSRKKCICITVTIIILIIILVVVLVVTLLPK